MKVILEKKTLGFWGVIIRKRKSMMEMVGGFDGNGKFNNVVAEALAAMVKG